MRSYTKLRFLFLLRLQKGAQYKFSGFKVKPPSPGNKIDNEYEIELLDVSDVKEVDEWQHKELLPASEYTPLSEWENVPLNEPISNYLYFFHQRQGLETLQNLKPAEPNKLYFLLNSMFCF